MTGEMGDEVPESEVTRGRTISREEPPTTATSAKDELDVRASSDQGSGQPPANGEQQRSGSRASTSSAPRGDSSNTANPSRVSWAALVGKGATGAKLDMRSVASPSRDDLPTLATPVSAIQDVSSGRPAGEAGLPVSRGLDEGVLSDSASGSSSVSRRDGSVSRGRRRNPSVSRGTIPVQQARQTSRPKSPAPTTSESTPLAKQEGEETQSSNPAPTAELIESTESKGLEDVRNYLRGLAESHGILHLVNKEPAPITCEQLLKNFASKVSEECSTWQEKLQIESSKLEASTQAHTQLEGEKTALQQIVATQTDKLGELGPLEQKARDLEVQFTKCINERDKLKSSLEANQNQLKTAQNECNEKEIALQHRTAELNEVQLRIQQMAPPVNEEELKSTISKLRDQLNAEMSARATAERKLEEEKGVWQAKEKRHKEDVSYMEKQLVDHQKQVKEALATVESLRKQLTDQTRKVSQAQIEVANMTFTVDHKNVPLAEYRKLVDNARGEVSDLKVRLAQAETERDEALKQDVPMDDMRDIIGEIVGFYGLAMDDAAINLHSNWREGEARLADLVCGGNDGFRRYPHAVVLSDEKPSQSLSDDLFLPPKRTSGAVASKCEESQTKSEPEERLNLAKELGEFNSQSSAEPEENQGSPDRTLQTIEDELSRLDRISSAGSQGSKVGQGDVSLELRNTKVALNECQHHRKEADKEIKDLKDEAKKLADEIAELKASARVLEQTIEEHESNAERTKGEANRPSAIQARDEQDFETNRKEADEKIKNLEVMLQQRTKELKRSQRKEEFMSQVSEQLKGQLSAVHDRLGKAEAKGEGSSGGPREPGKKRTGSGRMCGCPCLGACDSAGRPIAARQEVIHDLVTFYAKYRRCCGRKANMRSAASQTTAESASGTETAEVPEDDGLLLVRLAGLLHMDSDTRNRIENPRLSYLARLLLAFWSCIRIHGVAWKQTLYWLVAGSLYSAVYYLPGRRWRPGPPTTPSPKLVALAIKDAITLYWFYYLYQALMATWAVQQVYDMANGYTRAYYVERALHPERSRWWGLDGIDMRLSGFSTTEPPAPVTTDDGAAGIRRGL
ncbi:hypothetical protein CSPX01_05385 [Colletotrichum filicis]|nr:hypothetical protein CSPX01_05385 [Colletotrichum filicis]